MLKEILEEINENSWSWKGGKKEDQEEIERYVYSYDFYTAYIDSYPQMKKKEDYNRRLVQHLKTLGVKSFTDGKYTKEVR